MGVLLDCLSASSVSPFVPKVMTTLNAALGDSDAEVAHVACGVMLQLVQMLHKEINNQAKHPYSVTYEPISQQQQQQQQRRR